MIRRDTVDGAGTPAWLLIRQSEHARLAGMIADAWDLQDLPTPLRREVRWAATHHDDGWLEWEKSPWLDDAGRPVDFLEMSVEESNLIWARSIESAQRRSPLAAYLVARHFLDLRAGGTSADHSAAQQFAARFGRIGDPSFAGATDEQGPLDRVTVQRGLKYLQLFDVLSLTLCRGPVVGPVALELPAGEPLSFQPLSPCRMKVSPWCCERRSLGLQTISDQVAVRCFQDVQDLKRSVVKRRLVWMLVADTDANDDRHP
jgi:hypothetical protein